MIPGTFLNLLHVDLKLIAQLNNIDCYIAEYWKLEKFNILFALITFSKKHTIKASKQYKAYMSGINISSNS